VRHGVGKLSRKAITLVETSLPSKVGAERYELSKSRDSNSGQFRDSFGKKSHLNVASTESYREYYMGEGGGFPRVQAVVSQVNPSARGESSESKCPW